jgi:cell division protein FtsZ
LRDAKTVWLIAELRSWDLLFLQEKIEPKEAIVSALDSPLLNDNKITGAKNVLLLIVSGSEIT